MRNLAGNCYSWLCEDSSFACRMLCIQVITAVQITTVCTRITPRARNRDAKGSIPKNEWKGKKSEQNILNSIYSKEQRAAAWKNLS